MSFKEIKNNISKSLPEPIKKFLRIIIKAVKLYLKNDLPLFAASSSFFLIISSIPLFMIMFSTISYIPSINAEDIARNINLLFPNIPNVLEVIRYVMDLARSLSSSDVVWTNIITALITGSSCLFAFIIGIKKVHNITNSSNYALLKIMTILNIVILYLSVILTIAFFIFGMMVLDFADDYFPRATSFISNILSYRYLAVSLVLIVLTMSLYTCCANFSRNILKNIPGSIFTTLTWIITSNIFSIHFTRHPLNQSLYGSLSGIILALIWLYTCINLVFIGACVNEAIFPQSEIEKAEHLKTNHP